MINNARKKFVMKSLILVLVSFFLIFLSSVFRSGFLCQEGIDALCENNRNEALSCLEKSVSYYPEMAAYLQLSHLYYQIGRYDDAYNIITSYNKLLPFELAGLNNLAACQLKLKKFDECLGTLLKLEAYMSKSRGSAVLGAFFITVSGKIEEGVKKISESVLENPGFSASRFFCMRILKDPALRESFKRNFISLIRAHLEKNKNYLGAPYQNLSIICYNLYCRGFSKIYPAMISEFSGFNPSSFSKNYYTLFLKPESIIFSSDISFSRNSNFLYNYIITCRKLYNAIFEKRAPDAGKVSLDLHFGLKRWMYPSFLIDMYGLNESSPELPAYLITASYFLMDEPLLMSKIFEFYDLFYIARN